MILPGILSSQISGHLFTLTGAYDALATVTVPSGGVSSITFSAIPQNYTHLEIRAISRSTNASYYSQILFTINGTSSYFRHTILAGGTAAAPQSYSYTGQSYGSFGYMAGANALTNVFGVGILSILDYANTNKYKTWKGIGGADNNSQASPDTYISIVSGTYPDTVPINSITFQPESGNFAQFSQFSLYGIK